MLLTSDRPVEESDEPVENITSSPVATKQENEEQTAHILLSDRLLEAYYLDEEEEIPNIYEDS